MDSHRPESMEGRPSWDRTGSRMVASWKRMVGIPGNGRKVAIDIIRDIGAMECGVSRVRERRRGGRRSWRDTIAVAIVYVAPMNA